MIQVMQWQRSRVWLRRKLVVIKMVVHGWCHTTECPDIIRRRSGRVNSVVIRSHLASISATWGHPLHLARYWYLFLADTGERYNYFFLVFSFMPILLLILKCNVSFCCWTRIIWFPSCPHGISGAGIWWVRCLSYVEAVMGTQSNNPNQCLALRFFRLQLNPKLHSFLMPAPSILWVFYNNVLYNCIDIIYLQVLYSWYTC